MSSENNASQARTVEDEHVEMWVEKLTDWVAAVPYRTGEEVSTRLTGGPNVRRAWVWLVGEGHVVREVVPARRRPAHRWTLT